MLELLVYIQRNQQKTRLHRHNKNGKNTDTHTHEQKTHTSTTVIGGTPDMHARITHRYF